MSGLNGAAQIAAQANTQEVALRLCQAEVQAVLDKYQMMIGIKRIEQFVNGNWRVDYTLLYVPRPAAQKN